MLDFFRHKGLTSVVYGAMIVATTLVFLIGFGPSAGKRMGSVSESCVARIREVCIDPKAHRAAYRLAFSRGAPVRQAVASKIVLEGLVERELMISEASRLGLTVSDDEVTDSIIRGDVLLTLPSDNVQLQRQLGFDNGRAHVDLFKDKSTKQFDLKTYEKAVKMLTGRSPVEFREWQTRELLAAKMRDLVRSPVRVADDEAFERFVHERSTATVGYTVVRRGWIEKYAVPTDPKEIEAWAKDKANLAQVKVPVRHVLVKAGEKPEEKEAAKKKAEGLLERIKKGEDFAKIAKEFSEDPGSKDKGGQYPGEMVEQFVEPFRKAVESLKPGELDQQLVETQFGYHIIKRDEATKDDLAKAYKEAKSLELSRQLATKIIADVKAGKPGEEAVKTAIEPIAKASAAKAAAAPAKPTPGDAGAPDGGDAGGGAPAYTADTDPERPQWLSTSAFNRGGDPIIGVSGEASETVIKFAFGSKVGDVLEGPIRTDDGFVVTQLKDTKPASRADYDKERDTYNAQLLAAKQAEALGNYVRRLRESSKPEIKIDEKNLFGAKSDAGPTSDEDEGP